MKKLNFGLLLNLLKKDFLFYKNKKSFFVLNYDFILKTIKQFLRLKILASLPVYIVSKEKKLNIFLKKYLIEYLKIDNIKIVDNQILGKESIFIFIDSSSKNLRFKKNNLYFKFDNRLELVGFNSYKIFFLKFKFLIINIKTRRKKLK